MQKIIVAAEAGGFSLDRETVNDLFDRLPDLFDEPLSPAGFKLRTTESEATLLGRYWSAVMQDGFLRFLDTESTALRTDPLLVEKLEREGDAGLRGPVGSRLAIVDVPDEIDWYIFVDDDGSEAVCEKSRMWRPQKLSSPQPGQIVSNSRT